MQHHNLVYNNMKNLTYSLINCKSQESVFDEISYSKKWDNHIAKFFYKLHLNVICG